MEGSSGNVGLTQSTAKYRSLDSNMAFYFYFDLFPNLALSQQGFRENSQTASSCVSLLDPLTHTERGSSFLSFPLSCQLSMIFL